MKKYTISAIVLILLIIGAIYYTNAPGSLVERVENKITGTTTPAEPVSPAPSPIASATTSVTTASNIRTITQDGNGKTIYVKQGSRIVLSLGELNWTLNFSVPGIINRVKNIAVMRGSQGVYIADRVGTTILTAEGRPVCAEGMLCAQYIINFTATIVVTK